MYVFVFYIDWEERNLNKNIYIFVQGERGGGFPLIEAGIWKEKSPLPYVIFSLCFCFFMILHEPDTDTQRATFVFIINIACDLLSYFLNLTFSNNRRLTRFA